MYDKKLIGFIRVKANTPSMGYDEYRREFVPAADMYRDLAPAFAEFMEGKEKLTSRIKFPSDKIPYEQDVHTLMLTVLYAARVDTQDAIMLVLTTHDDFVDGKTMYECAAVKEL